MLCAHVAFQCNKWHDCVSRLFIIHGVCIIMFIKASWRMELKKSCANSSIYCCVEFLSIWRHKMNFVHELSSQIFLMNLRRLRQGFMWIANVNFLKMKTPCVESAVLTGQTKARNKSGQPERFRSASGDFWTGPVHNVIKKLIDLTWIKNVLWNLFFVKCQEICQFFRPGYSGRRQYKSRHTKHMTCLMWQLESKVGRIHLSK